MNRRNFLKMLGAGAVVTSTGLWMPGEKVISIPSKKVMTGTLVTDQLYMDWKTHTIHISFL